MHNRLHTVDTMQMGVQLPLPADKHQIRVEITAPTYRSVEVTRNHEGSTVTAVDFPLLYEWASREARITGYSKLYLLGAYLAHYQRGTGEPTEGLDEDKTLFVTLEQGEGEFKLKELEVDNGQQFLTDLYRLIREYETHLHDMLLSSDLEELPMEDGILWQQPSENLPALPGEVAPIPVEDDPFAWEEPMPDLIDLGDGEWVSKGKLIAEYLRLKEENEDLLKLKDSPYGEYVKLFRGMMNGDDSGIGFIALCLEEIQRNIQKTSNATDCFKALEYASQRLSEGAQLWTKMAHALSAFAPEEVKQEEPEEEELVPEPEYQIQSNDFREIGQFVFACAGFAQDEKKPLTMRVFKDSLNNEIGSFDWTPSDAGMAYNPQEAKAEVLSAIMESGVQLDTGCHHLVAFPAEDEKCIAAYTLWI